MGAGGVPNKLVDWETPFAGDGLSMVVVRNKSSRSARAAYLSEAEMTFLSGAAVVGGGAGPGG